MRELMVSLFVFTAPAKTIADCLKYRRKIGGNLAVKASRESIAHTLHTDGGEATNLWVTPSIRHTRRQSAWMRC
jgi:hypothetical protein